MFEFHLDDMVGIVTVRPYDALKSEDFNRLRESVDNYIAKVGILQGLIIDTTSFAGWNDFDAFKTHMKFIEMHHKKIARVAFVCDSTILSLVPIVADFFLQAEVKSFGTVEDAQQWINDTNLD